MSGCQHNHGCRCKHPKYQNTMGNSVLMGSENTRQSTVMAHPSVGTPSVALCGTFAVAPESAAVEPGKGIPWLHTKEDSVQAWLQPAGAPNSLQVTTLIEPQQPILNTPQKVDPHGQSL